MFSIKDITRMDNEWLLRQYSVVVESLTNVTHYSGIREDYERLKKELLNRLNNSNVKVAQLPTPDNKDPIPMILTCPSCCGRHIDIGEFTTKLHHTHACQHCGMVWRPAIAHTVGVEFLPGFKN